MLTCKITEITVAKIKIFGQDGWILTKFAKQKNDVLNDGNRQRGKIYTSQQIFCFEWMEFYLVFGICIMCVI